MAKNKITVDEIFQLKAEYENDSRKEKINGGIGVYLDEYGKPYVLDVVKKAIKKLSFTNFNYLPLSGDMVFLTETARLLLGNELYNHLGPLIAKQGVNGGTNGIYLWANIIKKIDKNAQIIIGFPTWENHERIFLDLGFTLFKYNHLGKDRLFNISALIQLMCKHPKTYVLLHGGRTHNPTGINLEKNHWDLLVKIMKEYKNQVLIDFAYMGLGQSINDDAYGIKLFLKERIPTNVVLSFSKNMTLYQQRTGALFMLAKSKKEKQLLELGLQNKFRIVNSSPPGFGEEIAKIILLNPELKQVWIKQLWKMKNSLDRRRTLFAKYGNKKFDYVIKGKGLFTLLDIEKKKILKLKKKYAIYLLSNGRINFGGISLYNIQKASQIISSEI